MRELSHEGGSYHKGWGAMIVGRGGGGLTHAGGRCCHTGEGAMFMGEETETHNQNEGAKLDELTQGEGDPYWVKGDHADN